MTNFTEKMFESNIYNRNIRKTKQNQKRSNPLSLYPWSTDINPFYDKKPKKAWQKCRKKKCEERSLKQNSEKHLESKLNIKGMSTIFLQNSSIYALNRIANSATVIQKTFWIVIFFVGIVGCVSQVGQFLTAYFKYPVVVNIESISTNKEEFPSVTVCNLNSVLRTFEDCWSKKINYDKCSKVNSFPSVESSTENNFDDNKVPMCEDADVISNFTYNLEWTNIIDRLLSLNYESRIKYGHQHENFIDSCYFNSYPCNVSDFVQTSSYVYGNCYTFNTNGTKYITNTGPSYGLELELNLEIDEYADFTRSVGARAQIHEPYLQHNIETRGVVLAPGQETHIAVAKSVISRLPDPFKDRCKEYDPGENQNVCKQRCKDDNTRSKCFCSVAMNKHDDGVQQCDQTNPLVWCCLEEVEETMICDCPLSCHEIQYNIQLSSADWPPEKYYENNDDDDDTWSNKSDVLSSNEDVRKSRLALRVYYDTLDFTVYKQNRFYQSSEVLSQIGGQMGLWLGLSLVAIFECLENIVILCRGRRIG